MRVLVIDDSDAVRVRLVERLVEAGLDVIGQAARPADGLAIVLAHAPDAVVLDARLRGGGGFELLAAIKAARPPPIVVVLTNAVRYRSRCLALGADAFLDKSAEFDAVAASIRRHAAKALAGRMTSEPPAV